MRWDAATGESTLPVALCAFYWRVAVGGRTISLAADIVCPWSGPWSAARVRYGSLEMVLGVRRIRLSEIRRSIDKVKEQNPSVSRELHSVQLAIRHTYTCV